MTQPDRVRLRPVERADLPTLDAWTNDADVNGEYNSFMLHHTTGNEAAFNRHGFLAEEHGMLLVIAGDAIVGSVSYRAVQYGPTTASRAYNIGIHLLPEARGKGYGAASQRMLAAYLFACYPVPRIEAHTDSTNEAEQRSLAKAGFTREGVLRQAQWRAGAWHDMVVYSMLRGE